MPVAWRNDTRSSSSRAVGQGALEHPPQPWRAPGDHGHELAPQELDQLVDIISPVPHDRRSKRPPARRAGPPSRRVPEQIGHRLADLGGRRGDLTPTSRRISTFSLRSRRRPR